MSLALLLAVMLVIVALPAPAAASSSPVVPDPGFGACGGAVVDLDATTDHAKAVAALADGRRVVVGYSLFDHRMNAVILGFHPDGSLDEHFGFSGLVLPDVEALYDVVVQDDGKVVAAGGGSGPALVRVLDDGSLDESFGGDGVAQLPGALTGSYVQVVQEASGSFLAVTPDAAFRVTADGQTTFLARGVNPIEGVLPTPDGGFYLVERDFRVSRHDSTGAVDASFGTLGRSSAVDLPTPKAGAVRLLRDGGVILGGFSDWSAALVRLDSEGALDETFDGDGVKVTAVQGSGSGTWNPPSFDAAGRLYLSGNRHNGTPSPGAFAARLTVEGALDPEWGSGGIYRHQVLDFYNELGTVEEVGDGTYIAPFTRAQRSQNLNMGLMTFGGHSSTAKGYVLDGWGGIHGFGTCSQGVAPKPGSGPYWPGWDIARGIATTPGGGGFVADGWGGLHPFHAAGGAPSHPRNGPYWTGWDIVRGVATTDDDTGYIVDGWGGTHPFSWDGAGAPPKPNDGPYWAGWDIARGIAVFPDGSGGYVLDGWGGLHPFGVGGNPPPPTPRGGPYWEGWDIARGVTLSPNGSGGYIVDGWGGLHEFSIGFNPLPAPSGGGPYWSRWDVASGVAIVR